MMKVMSNSDAMKRFLLLLVFHETNKPGDFIRQQCCVVLTNKQRKKNLPGPISYPKGTMSRIFENISLHNNGNNLLEVWIFACHWIIFCISKKYLNRLEVCSLRDHSIS